MIVVESGGTKSTWIFENIRGELQVVESVGLHPQELSLAKEQIIAQLVKENDFRNKEVYFFGAGCESQVAKDKITTFLQSKSLEVQSVETDIYAACVAHLGKAEGVVGILGTGAVAAHFDGIKVTKITSGWGYLLGDEGSGFDIGKRLLQSYLRGELSTSIRKEIEDYFQGIPMLHRIYEPDGRKFVAGLTKIVANYREESEISLLLERAFQEFYETALKSFRSTEEIYFIGSVAYYFKKELEQVLLKNNHRLGGVLKDAGRAVYSFLSSH